MSGKEVIKEYKPKSEEKIFLGDCKFIMGVVSESALPDLKFPEIAFAGRSNVGKSSIINALTNRKYLAKTSKTPGQTRHLNFFEIGHKFTIVDLPGYGYAKASKKEVKGWNNLIKDYLKGRVELRRVFLLIDSRHGIKNNDTEIMEFLDDLAVSYQIVLTKSDLIGKKHLDQLIKDININTYKNSAKYPDILFTSSRLKYGLSELRLSIASVLEGK